MYRLAYSGDVVAFKIGPRQGARKAHPAPFCALLLKNSQLTCGETQGIQETVH